jgi:hypothetical protein
MKKFVLLLGFVLPALAQSVPSDAAKLPGYELAQFMEIVCGGHIKDAQTCGVCPAESDFPKDEQGWRLTAITFGQFTATGEKEALISTRGCDSHAKGWGGSFLLRDGGHGYREVWYRAGYIATDCRKVKASDGRDLLICESSDMHFGVGEEFLYLLDPNWTDPPNRLFFDIPDTLGSCAALNDGYAITGYIESVEFAELRDAEKIGIAVKASAGRAVLPKKILDDCSLNSKPGADEYMPVIATKPLTFQFVFDGRTVQPAPGITNLDGMEPIVPVTSYFVPEPGHPAKVRR